MEIETIPRLEKYSYSNSNIHRNQVRENYQSLIHFNMKNQTNLMQNSQCSAHLIANQHYSNLNSKNDFELEEEFNKLYKNISLDKSANVIQRLLFDTYKRQTKEARLKMLKESNKVHMPRSNVIDRLVFDAKRRKENGKSLNIVKGNCKKLLSKDEFDKFYNSKMLYLKNVKEKIKTIKEKHEQMKENEESLNMQMHKIKQVSKKKIQKIVKRLYDYARKKELVIQNLKEKNDIEKEKELQNLFKPKINKIRKKNPIHINKREMTEKKIIFKDFNLDKTMADKALQKTAIQSNPIRDKAADKIYNRNRVCSNKLFNDFELINYPIIHSNKEIEKELEYQKINMTQRKIRNPFKYVGNDKRFYKDEEYFSNNFEREEGKSIYMCEGSENISSSFSENQGDENFHIICTIN